MSADFRDDGEYILRQLVELYHMFESTTYAQKAVYRYVEVGTVCVDRIGRAGPPVHEMTATL